MKPQERLERTQWDLYWVPSQVRIIDRPELAAIACESGRPGLNAVVRTRVSHDELPAIVDEVRQLHRSVPSRWMVPDTFDTRSLTTAIGQAGYAPAVHLEARALHVDEGEFNPRSALQVRLVQSVTALRDFWSVANQAFGRPFLRSDAELDEQLRLCLGPEARVRQYVAYDSNNSPVSAGGLSLFSDLGFGLLFAGSTVPDARGRGGYAAVLAARVNAARELGMDYVGLYALRETSAPIVARVGFRHYGEMTYWAREQSS